MMNGKRLTSAALGHLSIDVLNSSVAIILTYLSTSKFNLTVSQIGFGAMIYTLVAAFSQPLFGAVADRLRGRWLGAIGLLWTAAFFALATFANSFGLMVTCLSIGALGSGALHSFGMLNAADSGGHRPALATSIFFLGGQSGLALGPLVAGLLLQRMGLTALPLMALAMIPAIAMMAVYQNGPLTEIPPNPAVAPKAGKRPAENRTDRRTSAAVLMVTAFVLFITLRATTTQSFSTLLPKYFDDLGYAPNVYGGMIGAINFAGALGTFFGGFLGDRFNRRVLLFTSTLLSIPFSLALLTTEGWLYYVSACIAGLLLNIPHSILLVMAQQLLPARRGLIGGAVLGFMFASGAGTTWGASWFADQVGLPLVLTIIAVIPAGAALCALLLPATRNVAGPVAAPIATPAGD